ncbi:MAG: SpoIID/LytB domain-containing protein [Anaerolineae bacterium]
MTTKLCPHWIPVHPDQRDRHWLSRWRPAFIKLVFVSDHEIPQLDVALQCSQLVVARHHPVSENWESRGFRDAAHARETAQGHAAYLGRLWNEVRKKYPHLAPERLLWEGLNEPREWGDEPAALTAIYYSEFVRRMAAQGLRTVALNLGVGWPGNGGVQDAPPIWAPYEPVIEAISRHNGYLGLHEYWGTNGPQSGWRWLAGRYTQCPYQVPILVTECGIDAAVAGTVHYGYRGLSENGDVAARRFIEQLHWYDARLHEDPRVVGAAIFTYDFSPGWATFDYRNQEFMKPFLEYVNAQPAHDHGPIEPPVHDPIRVLMPDGTVRVMEVEQYLRAVVPAEVPALWPAEAVKAQAVAARSYARAAVLRPRHADQGADVCTTAHCQVYNEARIHQASDAAVAATAGEVLLYDNEVIPAPYSAACGGRTRGNDEVWGGDRLAYLQPVDCPCNRPKQGHGVGMCQWGAKALAERGLDYRAILKHYYTGVRLSSETPSPPPDVGDSAAVREAVLQYIAQSRAALEQLEAAVRGGASDARG